MNIPDDYKLIIVLTLFSACLFFIGLGAMPLTDPDEVFYAQTAQEMLNRGTFLTPYIFGKPQFEKPPFYYWLVMLSFRMFGINEFSARFASSIFGILGVIGVYLFGKILINRRTGFLAGIILTTSVIYLVLSRACVTDMVLGVFILYAFLFFFHRRYLLSSVFLGLAVLTKGPIGLLLPVAIIGIYLVLAKELKILKEIPIFRGTILFLAVSLPWYLLMYKVHGKEFIDVFFGFHNIIRFLEPEHKWGDVFYYYAPIVICGFLPWASFLPLGIWQAFKEKEKNIRRTNLFLTVWFLVIFIFFSLSRTKLPTYIFPLFPALALLTGRLWDVFLDKELSQNIEKYMRISFWLFFVFIIGSIVGVYFMAKIKYPTIVNSSRVIGIVLILFMAIFIWALLRKKYSASLIVFIVSFIIFVFPVSYIILPAIGRYESSKEISQKLLTLIRPEEELGAETHYRRGVAFYTDREDILDVHPHHVITKFLERNERVWCIIKEKNHIELYTDEKKPYWKSTYVVYKFGKKVIVTNKIPEDGEFLKVRTKNEPY